MPGPLSGYRIVDLTAMISGPLATMMADQGADVIKIESPAGGDHTRARSRRGGFSSFLNNDRNKRSIVLTRTILLHQTARSSER
ncbi:MAG: CoA transferase [Geminicoccales bacterium]